jgi:SAM-dependent methyltransferase
MTLVTKGDLIYLQVAFSEKGASYIIGRLNFFRRNRVITTWKQIDANSSDWWTIPSIRKRWNMIISGNESITYQEYLCKKYFSSKSEARLISAGCGGGTPEISFARSGDFKSVEGFDISSRIVAHANSKAVSAGLSNVRFYVADANNFDFGTSCCDVVLFHSSLHHFDHPEGILQKIKKALVPGGYIVIHEYTGPDRMQWTNEQLSEVNELLQLLPSQFKKRRVKGIPKNRVYKPGLIRTFLSDPSEAIHSSEILPSLHRNFEIVEEKMLGGNLLHLLFKDIAHHFIDSSPENDKLMKLLFSREDQFLRRKNKSDFTFGIYQKK